MAARYVDVSDTAPETVAKLLTGRGLEIAAVEKLGEILKTWWPEG
jgi:hypothetical protein